MPISHFRSLFSACDLSLHVLRTLSCDEWYRCLFIWHTLSSARLTRERVWNEATTALFLYYDDDVFACTWQCRGTCQRQDEGTEMTTMTSGIDHRCVPKTIFLLQTKDVSFPWEMSSGPSKYFMLRVNIEWKFCRGINWEYITMNKLIWTVFACTWCCVKSLSK